MAIGRPVLVGKPMLAAGKRDKFVTIEWKPAAQTVGSSRFPTETWSALRTAWMARLDLYSDERFGAGQQTVAGVETQWHMPYFADMDPDLVDVPTYRRLRYQGRVLDIVSATVIGSRQGIELMTLAQVARTS